MTQWAVKVHASYRPGAGATFGQVQKKFKIERFGGEAISRQERESDGNATPGVQNIPRGLAHRLQIEVRHRLNGDGAGQRQRRGKI